MCNESTAYIGYNAHMVYTLLYIVYNATMYAMIHCTHSRWLYILGAWFHSPSNSRTKFMPRDSNRPTPNYFRTSVVPKRSWESMWNYVNPCENVCKMKNEKLKNYTYSNLIVIYLSIELFLYLTFFALWPALRECWPPRASTSRMAWGSRMIIIEMKWNIN